MDASVRDSGDLSKICLEDIMGGCAFGKDGLTRGKDFEIVRGFAEVSAQGNSAAILKSASEEGAKIILDGLGESGEMQEVTVNTENPTAKLGGLSVTLKGVSSSTKVELLLSGSI